MFGFLWKKPEKQFNLNNSYLVIQFLTVEEKVQKDKIIQKLDQKFRDDLETIVPYASSFRYSYRYTLFSTNIKNKILLAEVMALIQANNNEELSQFYQTNVKKIKLHMKNNILINAQDVLQLYNERDISLYNPPDILQIVYEPRSFVQRMKVKTKKFVKNVPKYTFNLLSKILGFLLRFMGLGSINSVVSTFLPLKVIIKWVLNLLIIFFPPLAPFIGIGKLMM